MRPLHLSLFSFTVCFRHFLKRVLLRLFRQWHCPSIEFQYVVFLHHGMPLMSVSCREVFSFIPWEVYKTWQLVSSCESLADIVNLISLLVKGYYFFRKNKTNLTTHVNLISIRYDIRTLRSTVEGIDHAVGPIWHCSCEQQWRKGWRN